MKNLQLVSMMVIIIWLNLYYVSHWSSLNSSQVYDSVYTPTEETNLSISTMED